MTSAGTGPAEPNAARSSSPSTRTASETTAITIALRGPTFMNVCGCRRSATSETATISSSSASAFRFGADEELRRAATRRVPRTLASSTSRAVDEQRRQRVAGRRRGAEVAADRAAVADLRRADRARRLRERGQQLGERLLHRLGVGEARRRAAACRSRATSRAARPPRSGSGAPAAGARSKLSATITSVPPWIGTASRRSAFSRSASSRLRGVRTSTAPKRSTVRRPMADLARRLAVARGDEPADLVVRGGRVLSVFTREWLETDVAIADGFVAGPRRLRGRGDARRGRPLRRARLHRRAHAPRVVEAARRRVRAARAAARHDRGRRRPARDRERARHRRRALAARRLRRAAARRLLHGVVVRARVAVRVAAARADAGRPRRRCCAAGA